MRINVIKEDSYLSAFSENDFDAEELARNIEDKILATTNSSFIQRKGFDKGALSFLLSDISHLKDFISLLVNVSSSVINENIRPKTNIEFYCGLDLLKENESPIPVARYLDKIIGLKIKNKIVVTPRLKLYFEKLMPDEFKFDLAGEYNVSDDPDLVKEVMLHCITRKS